MKTLRNIIVATDFSDNAKSAYRYAKHLASHFGASIEVVHYYEIPLNPPSPNYMEIAHSYDYLQEQSDNLLALFIEEETGTEGGTMIANKVKTTVKSQAGMASQSLIELSKDPSVDLIVLGTTGEQGWVDKIFGSVSIKVGRDAFCPVLLVPNDTEFSDIHDIVYTSSFDSAQPQEIKLALDLAKYFVAAIHFIHVITNPNDLGISEKFLFEHLVENEHTKVPYSVQNIDASSPTEGINQYLLNHNVDLLVTVTQHRTFWEKLMYASTTKSLAWNVRLPLLVLHNNEPSHLSE
jgi:nucleotide-binding universal stress UspA family protein